MCVHTNTHMCTYAHGTYMYIHMHMHICTYTYLYIHRKTSTDAHMCTHTCTYTQMHTHFFFFHFIQTQGDLVNGLLCSIGFSKLGEGREAVKGNFKLFISYFTCICVHIRSPESGVRGSWSFHVDAANRTQVPCKSSSCSCLLNDLFRPRRLF